MAIGPPYFPFFLSLRPISPNPAEEEKHKVGWVCLASVCCYECIATVTQSSVVVVLSRPPTRHTSLTGYPSTH